MLYDASILQVLRLDANQIGQRGARELADAMVAGAFPRLSELHLRNNLLGDAGLQELLRGAAHCPELEVLCLDSNGLSGAGGQALCDALSRYPYPNMREIHIKHNQGLSQNRDFLARMRGVIAGRRSSLLVTGALCA
jgi:Ran GTPase-activating protein (RanGAP) involved in mRNA processing and transport